MNSVGIVTELKLWLCRTCLLEKSEQDMKEIEDIGNLLRDIIPIKLEKKYGWPTKICSDCLVQANQANQFRSMCIKSDTILTEIMAQTGKEDDIFDDSTDTYNSDFSSNSQSPVCEEEQEISGVYVKEEENMELCVKEEEEEINTIDDYTVIDESQSSIENQMEIEALECWYCEMKFRDKNELTNHKEKHLNERICHYCNRHFTTVKAYRIHIVKHLSDNPSKCNICNKLFLHAASLKRHVHTHINGKQYICHNCDKKFAEKSSLKEHIKFQHLMAPDEKPYGCECGKSFKCRRFLIRHKKDVHVTERKYLCNLCNKRFKNMTTLNHHELTHVKINHNL